MKKFEQCSLCLNVLSDPLTCNKGHIFCKACIVENLIFQKKEIKKKLVDWKNKAPSKELEKMSAQTENLKKIENLRTAEEGVVNFTEEITLDRALMSESDIDRFEMIKEFEKKKNLIFNRDKTELTRNCFWIPDLTPNCVVEEQRKPCE
jgi:nitric oxide synthase-interacting protein